MSKKKRNESCDGFEEWGGYMGAKKAKLIQQFALDNENTKSNESKIFSGIAIFVNGYTVPSADELKVLMIKYGGIYHHYYDSRRTTHVIASNLPNCKMKQLKTMKVVKPEWITDSIKANSLLDFRNYLLYTNQSKTQPRLLFGSSNISSSDKSDFEKGDLSVGNPVVSTKITSDNRSEVDVNNVEKEDKKERKYDDVGVLKVDEISPCNSKEMKVEMSLVSKISDECDNEIKDDLVFNYVQKSRFSTKESPTNLINNSNKNPDSTKNVTNTNKGNSSRMTASDANFLSEFYSNSRLHHISTMGATFKQYVNELRHKNNGMFLGRDKIKQWLDEQKHSSVNEDDDDENEDESCVASRTDISDKNIIIMHIDMDCFFVSVGIRNKPHLKGQPVAVTHAKANNSDKNLRTGVDFKAEIELYKNRIESKMKPRTSTVKNDTETPNESNNISLPRFNWISMIGENDSMSEIASCSYEARKAGIKNGMFLGQALKMCPNLKTIPYDFDAYKEVSYMLYDTIAEYTLDIEAVSCDEMFVDCTYLLKYISCSPMDFATYLRNQIKLKTGCPCSTGFGSNRLQARLATKKAKPDGQYYLQQQDLLQVMKNINVRDLPGVGKALACKLSAMNITTCLDLQSYSLSELRCEFGNKTGEALYNHCRGIDDRNLTFGHVRKSVSAEVNYGIRFQNQDEAEKFLHQLSGEVRYRLQEVQMKAKCITLKLMVKAKDAPEKTAKFLGHGFCDSISKSSSFTLPIADTSVISREVISIYRKLGISPKDLRGIGIQLSRLVPECSSEGRIGVLDAFLKPNVKPKPLTHERSNKTSDSSENADKVSTNKNNFFTKRNRNKTESKMSISECITHLDEDVLAELPEDIREEIINQYKQGNYDNLSENLQTINTLQKRTSDVSNNEHHLPVTNNIGYTNKFSFSQIDQSFVNALPIQLQEEIKSAFSSNKSKIIQNYDDDGLEVKKLGKPTKVKFKDEVLMAEVECESLDQMRDMVRTWVKEESSPQPNDVIMIYSTIVKLVYKHCLSDLTILINTLCRSVKKKNLNHSWKEAYSEIIRLIQEAMKTEYGGELKLECDING